MDWPCVCGVPLFHCCALGDNTWPTGNHVEEYKGCCIHPSDLDAEALRTPTAEADQVAGAVNHGGDPARATPTHFESTAGGSTYDDSRVRGGTNRPGDMWEFLVHRIQGSVPTIRERSRQLGIGARNGLSSEQRRVRSERVSPTSRSEATGATGRRYEQYDSAIGLGLLIAPEAEGGPR